MSWVNSYHVYTACMYPTLNGSSVLECFERSNVIKNTQWNNVRFLPGTATYAYPYINIDPRHGVVAMVDAHPINTELWKFALMYNMLRCNMFTVSSIDNLVPWAGAWRVCNRRSAR